MEFTLTYQGPLKANGNPEQKQAIRRALHPQLKNLWQQPPLKTIRWHLNPGMSGIRKSVGAFTFAPLVSEYFYITAELDILFLRPEPPGSILTQGGDIDNRLKTLFDALRVAQTDSEIPPKDKPGQDEDPLLCVLEDDNLITKVTVKTDRLLIPPPSKNHVHLIIGVKTKITEVAGHALVFV